MNSLSFATPFCPADLRAAPKGIDIDTGRGAAAGADSAAWGAYGAWGAQGYDPAAYAARPPTWFASFVEGTSVQDNREGILHGVVGDGLIFFLEISEGSSEGEANSSS